MKKQFKPLIITSLILVYLVIAAGAVVRMTGSGMGCPDWPKCFGYLIPPTERNQLDWKSNHQYREGEVIIVNESLRVASSDFNSSEEYESKNWETYTKHDYALFNATHTWIEFINRLLGALAGLATLFLFISSLWRIKTDLLSTVISFLVVLGMGFQGCTGSYPYRDQLKAHYVQGTYSFEVDMDDLRAWDDGHLLSEFINNPTGNASIYLITLMMMMCCY